MRRIQVLAIQSLRLREEKLFVVVGVLAHRRVVSAVVATVAGAGTVADNSFEAG